MIVAVVGSRGLNMDISKFMPEHVTGLITGGAKGIDTLAERYGEERAIPVRVIKPEYGKYGKAAPLMRNKEIIDRADMAVILWDGASKGTKHVIDYAKSIGKPVRVYLVTLE